MNRRLYSKLQQVFLNEANILIGDRVRIVGKAEHGQLGWSEDWSPAMNHITTGVVRSVCDHGILINNGDYNGKVVFNFPFWVLQKIKVVVKDLSDIIDIEIKKGAEIMPCHPDGWIISRKDSYNFNSTERVGNCGKEPDREYLWPPEWLREVDEETD